jgi:putative ABC transport system substrate-binding protein
MYEYSMGGKWIDLIRQVVPDLTHVAVIFHADSAPQIKFLLDAIKSAAALLHVEVTVAPVHDPEALARAIENVSLRPHGAGLFAPDPFLQSHRQLAAELAVRYRLPAISYDPYFPVAASCTTGRKPTQCSGRPRSILIAS